MLVFLFFLTLFSIRIAQVSLVPVEKTFKVIHNITVYDQKINDFTFNYLINPGQNICGSNNGKDVFAIVIVKTSPMNLAKRLSIRETWARRSMFRNIRLLFVIGSFRNDPKLEEKIILESNIYGDILKGDFIDSYNRLVEKGLFTFKWVMDYCSNAKYLISSDDDMVVNMFFVLRHLKRLNEYLKDNNHKIICSFTPDNLMPVLRDPNSKWYVSKEEYDPDFYTQYCSGAGYIIDVNHLKFMYNVSFYVKYIWVDDFFLTVKIYSFM